MATEETKPVERETFEQDALKLRPRLDLRRFDSDDYRSPFTAAMFDSWDAALERAARTVESTIWCYNGAQANNVRECAEKIRALKGRGRCPIVI
jgi:hypothetical protein